MTEVPTISVRDARPNDLEHLIAFNAAMAHETENKTLDPDVLRAGIAAVLTEPARGFYLVAQIDGVAAGCLMVTFEWSDWRNGDWWWLQSVYVRPEHRRGGVFRALYAEVERRAAMRNDVVGIRLYVERENARAQRTYESLGLRAEHYRLYGKPLRAGIPSLGD